MLEADKIAQAKTNFIQRLKMDGEELTQFQEAFSERMELKSFKASDIEKHLEKAYREVNDDPEVLRNLKNQEAIGKTMAT
ncbi:MAG: hypothetical protein GY827_10785 [Cytophagales bacterium]|nr:hypothetical protein [Cytophagales bacterium]